MASSQSPNRVYFTSFDRQATDTNTDFTITFDTPIQNAYNFEVVQSSFPNLLKPFAKYETILYFYHESFFNGGVALGIPLSTAQFAGTTGEALPVTAGRETYIDKRFFADGNALATYLTNWVQSLAVSFPAVGSGLQPFYFPNDDPTETPVFLAVNTTGINFANLSFTYDDLTGDGTLKLTFADSTPLIVRVASTFDFGSLALPYPSQLGYKLGYTSTKPEAFATTTVNVTNANNQFTVGCSIPIVTFTSGNNKFNIFASAGNVYPDTVMTVTIPAGFYDVDDVPGVVQAAIRAADPRLGAATVTQAAGVISITLNFSADPSVEPSPVMGLNFSSGQGGNAEGPACAGVLGYTVFPTPFILQQPYGIFTFTADSPMSQGSNFLQSNTITIPPNAYTQSAMATILTQLITDPATNNLAQYMNLSSVTELAGVLTFTFGFSGPYTVSNYNLKFPIDDPQAIACQTLLGFASSINNGPIISAPFPMVTTGTSVTPDFHYAPDPINLVRTSLVYFASSLSSGESLASAGRKDILFAVALTAGVGQVQQYQSSLSGIVINRPPSTIRNIRLTLLDDNFQVLEPLPENASITTEIHFAYNEDAKAAMRDKASTNIYA